MAAVLLWFCFPFSGRSFIFVHIKAESCTCSMQPSQIGCLKTGCMLSSKSVLEFMCIHVYMDVRMCIGFCTYTHLQSYLVSVEC